MSSTNIFGSIFKLVLLRDFCMVAMSCVSWQSCITKHTRAPMRQQIVRAELSVGVDRCFWSIAKAILGAAAPRALHTPPKFKHTRLHSKISVSMYKHLVHRTTLMLACCKRLFTCNKYQLSAFLCKVGWGMEGALSVFEHAAHIMHQYDATLKRPAFCMKHGSLKSVADTNRTFLAIMLARWLHVKRLFW